MAQDGDLLLMMGAGNIGNYANNFHLLEIYKMTNTKQLDNKINVLLLCGGGGSEHDISLMSVKYLEKC